MSAFTPQQREEVRQIIREEKRLRGLSSVLSDRFEAELAAMWEATQGPLPPPREQSGGEDDLRR